MSADDKNKSFKFKTYDINSKTFIKLKLLIEKWKEEP